LVPTIDRAAECDGDLGTINASLRRSLEDRSYLGMLLTASAEHVQSMENDPMAVKLLMAR